MKIGTGPKTNTYAKLPTRAIYMSVVFQTPTNFSIRRDCKKNTFAVLASLGIMGTQIRAPFKSLCTIVLWWYPRGFRDAKVSRTARQKPFVFFVCTHREIFKTLLNQTEIRLYLPCTDLFGTANEQRPFAVSNQSQNNKDNLISVRFNKISRKKNSLWHCYGAIPITCDLFRV